jgi:hypothetical protein
LKPHGGAGFPAVRPRQITHLWQSKKQARLFLTAKNYLIIKSLAGKKEPMAVNGFSARKMPAMGFMAVAHRDNPG